MLVSDKPVDKSPVSLFEQTQDTHPIEMKFTHQDKLLKRITSPQKKTTSSFALAMLLIFFYDHS
jgi:hypothetical protein